MTTHTPEIRSKLEHYLETHHLPRGIGNKESACSIAAINLVISGKLTDDIPDCMSEVIGRATIILQDAMPDEMRNSARYKSWLPTAVGTGRGKEQERLKILMDWLWGTVLPQLQALADENGFGDEWRAMCSERTDEAARVAADAAARAAYDARVARVAAHADDAAHTAAHAAHAAAEAAYAARIAHAADEAARVAARAADAAAAHAAYDARVAFWEKVDPIGVLERMTNPEDKS